MTDSWLSTFDVLDVCHEKDPIDCRPSKGLLLWRYSGQTQLVAALVLRLKRVVTAVVKEFPQRTFRKLFGRKKLSAKLLSDRLRLWRIILRRGEIGTEDFMHMFEKSQNILSKILTVLAEQLLDVFLCASGDGRVGPLARVLDRVIELSYAPFVGSFTLLDVSRRA